METPNWSVTVLQGLRAHFKQPDGASKRGTDWIVSLRNEVQEFRVIVRAFGGNAADVQEPEKVAEFVATILRQGWTPQSWRGEPGELAFDII